MSNNTLKTIVLQNLCDWCGKLVPLSNEGKTLVCSNCYRILHNAGLSDASIFEETVGSDALLAIYRKA